MWKPSFRCFEYILHCFGLSVNLLVWLPVHNLINADYARNAYRLFLVLPYANNGRRISNVWSNFPPGWKTGVKPPQFPVCLCLTCHYLTLRRISLNCSMARMALYEGVVFPAIHWLILARQYPIMRPYSAYDICYSSMYALIVSMACSFVSISHHSCKNFLNGSFKKKKALVPPLYLYFEGVSFVQKISQK